MSTSPDLDIVFTRSSKSLPLFSWAIMLWTGKDVSHVARKAKILGQTMYYQASEGKVNYEHEQFFSKKHHIVRSYSLSIPESMYLEMSTECLKDCGNIYGTLQNVGIVIVDILAVLGVIIDNPFKKGRNCSELLYVHVLKKLIPQLDYNPDTIKPHHLERIILKYFTQDSKGAWGIK